ncbi:MAG: hypothetical protein LBK53_02400 [Heliobacteriaceae bacterium]|nr:hypothetical protein [Heliobacteriaceae bacterium]
MGLVKSNHNHPVILNLFQDLALGKSHYPNFNICTGKKILQKLNIFAIGQILKHQRSIWSFRMT